MNENAKPCEKHKDEYAEIVECNDCEVWPVAAYLERQANWFIQVDIPQRIAEAQEKTYQETMAKVLSKKEKDLLFGLFQPFLARYSVDRPIPPAELRQFLDKITPSV